MNSIQFNSIDFAMKDNRDRNSKYTLSLITPVVG